MGLCLMKGPIKSNLLLLCFYHNNKHLNFSHRKQPFDRQWEQVEEVGPSCSPSTPSSLWCSVWHQSKLHSAQVKTNRAAPFQVKFFNKGSSIGLVFLIWRSGYNAGTWGHFVCSRSLNVGLKKSRPLLLGSRNLSFNCLVCNFLFESLSYLVSSVFNRLWIEPSLLLVILIVKVKKRSEIRLLLWFPFLTNMQISGDRCQAV